MAKLRTGTVWLNILLIVLFSMFLWLLKNELIVFGAASGNWVYPYIGALAIKPVLIVLLLSPVIVLLVHLTHRYIHCETAIVCLWFVIGFISQIYINSLSPFSFVSIIRSDVANSFYGVSLKYEFRELLSTFSAISSTLPIHARSNMVGKILFFYLLRLITPYPRRMGYLIVLFSNVGGVLTYLISKKLFKSSLTAIYAFIFYFFIPAKLFFFPVLNTVSPVFILLSFLLFLQYLESHENIWLLLLGSSCYLVLIFEPTPFILGIVFLAFLIRSYWEKKTNKTQLIRIAVYSLSSFLLVHFLTLLIFKYNALDNLVTVSREAATFNIEASRPYGIWVLNNLKDFFVNSGFLQALLFLFFLLNVAGKIINMYKDMVNKNVILQFIMEPSQLLALSFTMTLLSIDLIGINRGEVVRLWIFLIIFVQIIVSYLCATKLSKSTFCIVLTATILQAVTTIAMVCFVKA